MKRLTFGVTSSPFLATKVLRQLAEDYQSEFPRAAQIIKESFYVDDCLTGADTLEEAKLVRQELNEVMRKGAMTLRKWRSNFSELLSTIPEELKESGDLIIAAGPEECFKTLGVHWDTGSDSLHISTPTIDVTKTPTKRQIASVVAKVFDILGWFAPAILPAKILLQDIWKLKLDWDDPLPDQLIRRWQTWTKDLSVITSHPISRCLGLGHGPVYGCQLHGFSDASTSALGGVVYLRSLHADTSVSIDIILSKCRVAPLEKRTIPRMELEGALLLSKLLSAAAKDLNIPSHSVFAWTDSAIVLGWLQKPLHNLKTYVAHRVEMIVSRVNKKQWRYVHTSCNPADLLSRGVKPSDLVHSDIWWKGPPWLQHSPDIWPKRPDINYDRELPELRPTVLVMHPSEDEFGLKFSSYSRLLRVLAWMRRFITKIRDSNVKLPDYLTVLELCSARAMLLVLSQKFTYGCERDLLMKAKHLPDSHSLASLSPYLDSRGIMRVGGRLQKAGLGYNSTHPILLSIKSHTTQLIVEHTHIAALHAGSSTVMALLADSYHIPRLKCFLRALSRRCLICRKTYAQTSKQCMGELPADRVRPARPFSTVGLDFAGPFILKLGHTRKPTLINAYVCVFVCFTTRACHLEVVSDLSTTAFFACLRRFLSRRGLPHHVYSDNGSNFVGANNRLKEIYNFINTSNLKECVTNWAAPKEIRWSFLPSRAPHFGGLWEAAVESMKLLLLKTLGGCKLRFDEMTTVLTEVEAMLNSRPLVPLDSVATDGIAPLTPGHFLIGAPLAALPSLPDQTSYMSLRRWNLVQHLTDELWQRWQTDYLTHLQRRSKWKQAQHNLQVNDIVLMKDVSLFQRTWKLGRVAAIYKGTDGLVRVVDVTNGQKTYRRPVHKLVKLLHEENDFSCRGEDVRAASGNDTPSPSSE